MCVEEELGGITGARVPASGLGRGGGVGWSFLRLRMLKKPRTCFSLWSGGRLPKPILANRSPAATFGRCRPKMLLTKGGSGTLVRVLGGGRQSGPEDHGQKQLGRRRPLDTGEMLFWETAAEPW